MVPQHPERSFDMKQEIDFGPYFSKYEQLVMVADKAFERVQEQYPEHVRCKTTCSDCCHALFDLTLIEALYINHHFNDRFKGRRKELILERANVSDRKVYKLKREAYKAIQDGKQESEILFDLAKERVRCPLLSDDKMCEMYEQRPITCRLYGIPTTTQGASHTCGLSGFKEGEAYPSANFDAVMQRMHQVSKEVTEVLKSKYAQLPSVLVPLSMALLNVYDAEYLGVEIKGQKPEEPEDKEG
jgi:Fe-S-cluster containining protein